MMDCPLTELNNNRMFLSKADEFKKTLLPNTYCMVAIDIEHFRLFNKLHTRNAGDQLLTRIAGRLKEAQTKCESITGYFGGDNFAILMPDNQTLIEELRDAIIADVRKWNNSVGFYPLLGVYTLDDLAISSEVIYDRATIALSYVAEHHVNRICRFVPEMETKLEEEVSLLSEIQLGLERDEFTFFAQPQCDISTGRVVGAEALVRWIHGVKGLISPGLFVPVLEKNGMMDILDRYVWKKVCEWLRSWIDRGYTPVPISINVSRIDILSMDVPAYLSELLKTYQLPEKLLKVEITESAYVDNNDKISTTVQKLRDKGLTVMMDDFGSGYSSLNMLKNISVDVLKLDMRFLDMTDNDEEKGIGILESIVNMARLMRLPIVAEGVETETQVNFLRDMGCRYTQGYYYYKPLPLQQLEELLSDERRLDFGGMKYKQIEPIHVKEFLDDNFFSDTMLNNVLGPVAFYEMYENQIELTRTNIQYSRLTGLNTYGEGGTAQKYWNHVRDDDRALLYTIFEKAYRNPSDGADGHVHFVRIDGTVLQTYLRVFFLREKDGRKQFYGSLTDVTSMSQEKEEPCTSQRFTEGMSQEELAQLKAHFENLPYGYAVARILETSSEKIVDYELIYCNRQLKNLCAGDLEQLKNLAVQAFADNQDEIYRMAFQAMKQNEDVHYYAYSNISNRYLQFTFYRYRCGYVACMVNDNTQVHVHENALNSIMRSFREVHYVHLQNNYCRMIYPYENHIMDRGNYEETINRRFYTGIISSQDEKNVRRFLSLENLRKVLSVQDTTEYSYNRSTENNSNELCLTSFTVSERDSCGAPKTAIAVVRSMDSLFHKSGSKKAKYMAETLASMSEGFFIYRTVDEEKIVYISPMALHIFGCETLEEFHELVGSSFRGMVHPEDLGRVEWEIQDQIMHSSRNLDYTQYRIIRKDGEIRWLDDFGHMENAGIGAKGGLFYVFISDITDTISEGRKNRLINRSKAFNENNPPKGNSK